MAYMSKTEREQLTKDVHKTYAWRKFLIFINIALLIAFIVLTFISFYKADQDPESFWNFFNEDKGEPYTIKGLSTWGIIMLVWACIMVVMSVAIIVLTFSMHSPSKVTKEVLELEAAPINSKKIAKSDTRTEINKERIEGREIKKPAKKGKKK